MANSIGAIPFLFAGAAKIRLPNTAWQLCKIPIGDLSEIMIFHPPLQFLLFKYNSRGMDAQMIFKNAFLMHSLARCLMSVLFAGNAINHRSKIAQDKNRQHRTGKIPPGAVCFSLVLFLYESQLGSNPSLPPPLFFLLLVKIRTDAMLSQNPCIVVFYCVSIAADTCASPVDVA